MSRPNREDALAELRDVAFPTAVRGYDRIAVDEYVTRVNEVLAELETMRTPDGAVKRAIEKVGEDTASVLQSAHHAAEQMKQQARAEADEQTLSAQREGMRVRQEAEAHARQADQETDAVWQERARLLEDVRRIADELGAVTAAADERMSSRDDEPIAAAADAGPIGDPTTEMEVADADLDAVEVADDDDLDAANGATESDDAAEPFSEDVAAEPTELTHEREI